ncbi:bacteriocin immunity protein [Pseudomonas sp.]|uniref:bacteriocin immunity protein n=1 Tax=Pseudomonas sp. TaxID=306 RepID=UPI0028B1BE5F|nr:bacteriocin immunity protein [Pseudomonas sp.]
MDLRPTLDQYEESAFLAFVDDIWNAETDRASHDAAISHFNAIVGHPAGSDLLFYSPLEEVALENSPGAIVFTVKSWHTNQGRAAFKDQPLPPPPIRQQLTREEQAIQRSELKLREVRTLVTQLDELQLDAKLVALQQSMLIAPPTGTPEQQLADDLAALRTLEAAQVQATAAAARLRRLQTAIDFALKNAQSDARFSSGNAEIQAVVLHEITLASQRHAAVTAVTQARHTGLYDHAVTVIEQLEARIAQSARASGSGPGHGALRLLAPMHWATTHPLLLTEGRQHHATLQSQRAFNQSLYSALAELEWQVSALDGKHAGLYADVAELILATPSEDPRFALAVPLNLLADVQTPD